MKADISRSGFNPLNHFRRVIQQQGRVQLDADINEQTDILLHQLRLLARTLIGEHGGAGDSFRLGMVNGAPVELKDLLSAVSVAPGIYYADGVACENDAAQPIPLNKQQDFAWTDDELEALNKDLGAQKAALVYLLAWERHITYLEEPRIREVALGVNGPDTTTRSKLVWQVRVIANELAGAAPADRKKKAVALLGTIVKAAASTGRLRARALRPNDKDDSPCSISPQAQYRGPENQLYRIEIHRGGSVAAADPASRPTFVWSRENGSVALPVVKISGPRIELGRMGRDQRYGLRVNDWIEFEDDASVLGANPLALTRITGVFTDENAVTVDPPPAVPAFSTKRHPILRRWDHKADDNDKPSQGALPVKENEWIALEDGVEIQFETGGQYQRGDAWLIPARVESEDVDWPYDPASPANAPERLFRHAAYIRRYYAPLGVLSSDAGKWQADPALDLRNSIKT